ncbi:General secretion pathway protein H (fragment) [Candidatus Nitrosacidococcus tergens]|uniref:General secretion pathway protein H n=2 Tax=Candidatus Nitrosacidococcus tergens TaxID=553981 RepID=A0A7G1Q7J2_9GAMM
MSASQLSEEYTYATSLAESKLATIGTETLYLEGVNEGEFDEKYHWRTTVILYEQLDPTQGLNGGVNNQAGLIPVLYKIKVEVFWKSTYKKRIVTLNTFRLGSI